MTKGRNNKRIKEKWRGHITMETIKTEQKFENGSNRRKPKKRFNAVGLIGMILGIIGLILCPFAGGIVLGVPALILGIIGAAISNRNKMRKGMAVAAIVLGSLGFLFNVIGGNMLTKETETDIEQTLSNALSHDSKFEESKQNNQVNSIKKEPEKVFYEINADIPLGTQYSLNQGNYEVGTDIPAGRYEISYLDGNQFGIYVSSSNAKQISHESIDPGETYTAIISEGEEFEISLGSCLFKKISSCPNENYKQTDGTYVIGEGYFYEGIDIPSGKYNVKVVGGNPFGIYLSTKNDRFISLEQGEEYNNLKLNHEGAEIKVSLGQIQLIPKQ